MAPAAISSIGVGGLRCGYRKCASWWPAYAGGPGLSRGGGRFSPFALPLSGVSAYLCQPQANRADPATKELPNVLDR